jgi:CheY-like chemotaxis protein/predicted regulator of Ras-like GTPase activity (Roadblock/LC7/MglB family)
MGASILVVDGNEAFSTMLREMLEAEGGYHVETVPQGSAALAYLREHDCDLTIVDVDLDPADIAYDELIPRIRQLRSSMRLMLMPLMGEELPAQARRFDIQGTLSKPFFADDLLPNIQEALSRAVSAPADFSSPVPLPAPARAVAEEAVKPAAGVQRILSDLVRETQADAVLLVSFSGEESEVTAHISTLEDDQIVALAHLGVETVQAARAAAHFLGQPDAPFEHNVFENDALRLYIMAISGTDLLMVVAPGNTPLGTIRYNVRRAGRDLVAGSLT